ncbi:MAG: hypothetical protein DMG57_25850 [Acidobacteria bacterium]|nr:MAG: hypothetical protein DMG57_25850 [Acidobacteriota bacterium]
MRTLLTGASLYFLVPLLAFGGQVKGTCERPFEANFQSGGKLRLELRSGDIDVTGTDAQVVRVTCELKRPEREKDITIRFDSAAGFGDLRISGGPNSDVKFRIEVPKNSNLVVRSPAGDLSLSGVVGDKDVEIHAGDLTISVGDPASYKHADASVYAGDLNAGAFGIVKDGLFRSFNKDNSAGKYRLHAHVAAGDLILK